MYAVFVANEWSSGLDSYAGARQWRDDYNNYNDGPKAFLRRVGAFYFSGGERIAFLYDEYK